MLRLRTFAPRALAASLVCGSLAMTGCARQHHDPFASIRDNQDVGRTASVFDHDDEPRREVRSRHRSIASTAIGDSGVINVSHEEAEVARQAAINQFLADNIDTTDPAAAPDRRRTPSSRVVARTTDVAEGTSPFVSPDLENVSRLRALMENERKPAETPSPAVAQTQVRPAEPASEPAFAAEDSTSEISQDPFEVLRQLEEQAGENPFEPDSALASDAASQNPASAPADGQDRVMSFDEFMAETRARGAAAGEDHSQVDDNPFGAPIVRGGAAPQKPEMRSPFDPPRLDSESAFAATEEARQNSTDLSDLVEELAGPPESLASTDIETHPKPTHSDWAPQLEHSNDGWTIASSEPPAPQSPDKDSALVVANFVGSEQSEAPIVRVEANRPVSITDATEIEPHIESSTNSEAEVAETPVTDAISREINDTRMQQLQAPIGPELASPAPLAVPASVATPQVDPPTADPTYVELGEIEFSEMPTGMEQGQKSQWWSIAGGIAGAAFIGLVVGRWRSRKSS